MTKIKRIWKPQATLCFLTKKDSVLLGMKKRSFAEGKWNGFGGKQNDTEKNIGHYSNLFDESDMR